MTFRLILLSVLAVVAIIIIAGASKATAGEVPVWAVNCYNSGPGKMTCQDIRNLQPIDCFKKVVSQPGDHYLRGYWKCA